ncbi:hypothetical protein J6590_099880 [Homalodisca vitripennis]|nr:hypothetical protein J6590_099880 [Homalodisca vitripennis]
MRHVFELEGSIHSPTSYDVTSGVSRYFHCVSVVHIFRFRDENGALGHGEGLQLLSCSLIGRVLLTSLANLKAVFPSCGVYAAAGSAEHTIYVLRKSVFLGIVRRTPPAGFRLRAAPTHSRGVYDAVRNGIASSSCCCARSSFISFKT